jgi:transcription initiation factor IIE alpha subunit
VIVFVSARDNPVNSPSDRMIHLPPSAKLVYKVLETDGALTQKDLIQKTTLPSRTVRYAIGRLREADIISERFHFLDARQSLYGLKTAPEGVV